MEKRLLKKIIAHLILIDFLSAMLTLVLLCIQIPKNIFAGMETRLTHEAHFYQESKEMQQEKLNTYTDDYITRITVLEYMLENHEELHTAEGMVELQNLFHLEALYAFDESGVIVQSSDAEALNTGLLKNEAAQDFWNALTAEKQDMVLTFDSGEILEYGAGLNYIAIHSPSGPYALIMAGIDAGFSETLLEDISTAGLLHRISTTQEESLFAVDKNTGEILGESYNNDPILNLADLGTTEETLELILDSDNGRMVWLNHRPVLLKTKIVEDVILVELRQLKTQIQQTLFMFLGIVALLTVSIFMIIIVIKRYFRQYVFNEIDAIQNTVQRQLAGEEGVTFQVDNDTEMGLIAKALNDWSRSTRLSQKKLNWLLTATGLNTAIFEVQSYLNRTYWSDNFQSILGVDDEEWNTISANTTVFSNYLRTLAAQKNEENIVSVNDRFLRIEVYQMEGDYFGVIIDKTDLILRRSKDSQDLQHAISNSEADSLTGLLNRRGFAAHANKTLVNRTGSATMLILDIDNFKQVNDTLGHPTGDKVLQKVAEVLRSVFRNTDITARIGGDEFMVLMSPGVPFEGLDVKLQTLLDKIEEELSIFGCGLSVSIGVVWTADTTAEYKMLYQWADEALYTAKRAGKKQYIICEH